MSSVASIDSPTKEQLHILIGVEALLFHRVAVDVRDDSVCDFWLSRDFRSCAEARHQRVPNESGRASAKMAR